MKLLVADLSNIFHSAFHAGADRHVGFAYEVSLDRIRRAARGFDRVIVACDAGHSGRRDIDPNYKAGRPERDPMMIEQLHRTQDALETDGFFIARADGYEADDVIGTICSWAAARGDSVEIISSDKDALCLVSATVKARSVRTNELFGPEEVLQKFGVRPSQMTDYLTLVGDSSDNIRGVPKIGAKHAAALLGQFGSLGGIIEAIDAKDENDNPVVKPPSILGALLTAVRDGTIELARKLVTLRTDAPIDCAAILEERAPKPQRPDFGTDLEPEADDVENEPKAEETVEATPTALAIRPEPILATPTDQRWALEPMRMRDAVWLSGKLFESRLFGGYGSPEQVLAVVLAGREMNLGAMTALRGMHLIKGKVAMGAQLMVGLCLSSGRAEYFDLVESDAKHAAYVTKRKGSTRDVSMTFTIDQAKQMGLLAGSRSGELTQWDKDPENMLRHRCSSRLARVAFPDVCSNCYLPEELEEDVGR